MDMVGFIEDYDLEDDQSDGTVRRATSPIELHDQPKYRALNPNAWVLSQQGLHHICNDRNLYVSYDEIEPLPLHNRSGKTSDIAIGVGMVRLTARLKNGQDVRMPFGEVLFVPSRKVNSLSLKRLNEKDTVVVHSSGFAYDSSDRNIMWFPLSGGLPTLRLAGVFDQLYLDSYTDDERLASYSDCWVRQQPAFKAANGLSEALHAIQMIKDSAQHTDPIVLRRRLARRVANITVDDLVKLLGIHALSSPDEFRALPRIAPVPQPGRPMSVARGLPPARSSPCANNRSSSAQNNRHSTPGTYSQISKGKFIKEGWGSRPNFQYSYGLKMTPEDIEEGNIILEEFRKEGLFR